MLFSVLREGVEFNNNLQLGNCARRFSWLLRKDCRAPNSMMSIIVIGTKKRKRTSLCSMMNKKEYWGSMRNMYHTSYKWDSPFPKETCNWKSIWYVDSSKGIGVFLHHLVSILWGIRNRLLQCILYVCIFVWSHMFFAWCMCMSIKRSKVSWHQ